MLKKIAGLFILAILLACNSKENKVQDLHSELMEIHDEVMPKMANLHASRKELEIALNQGADSTKVFELLKKIDAADESMMVWMDEFNMPDSSLEEAIILEYLASEKIRILEVKQKIESSVSEVSTFSSKYIESSIDSLR